MSYTQYTPQSHVYAQPRPPVNHASSFAVGLHEIRKADGTLVHSDAQGREWIQKPTSPPKASQVKGQEVDASKHIEKLGKAFESGENSDLTIVSSGHRYQVHKFILSLHSPFFNKLLNGGFKETNQSEITLHEDDPQALYQVLRYLYVWTYDPPIGTPFLKHIYVALIADKYDIPDLANIALDVFKRRSAILPLDSPGQLEELAKTIKEVYSNEVLADFRKVVVQTVYGGLRHMRADKENFRVIWDVIESNNAFAVDLLMGPDVMEGKGAAEVKEGGAREQDSTCGRPVDRADKKRKLYQPEFSAHMPLMPARMEI